MPEYSPGLDTRIDLIAGDIYRIALWNGRTGITFNQFLIAGDRPALELSANARARGRVSTLRCLNLKLIPRSSRGLSRPTADRTMRFKRSR